MIIQAFLALIALIIGSITDLERHEVPDWVNFGLIFCGVAFGAGWSISAWSFWPLLDSLLGLAIGFAIGWIMYYTGQWGGGDAKMIMGIGAMLGAGIPHVWSVIAIGNYPAVLSSSFFILFLVLTIFSGALYGILWSLSLIVRNWKRFAPEYARFITTGHARLFRYASFVLTVAFLVFAVLSRDTSVLMLMYLVFAVLVFSSFYLFSAIKVVEKVCMIKDIPPSKLTEGDWIAKDIIVGNKTIAGPKDLGISKEQIADVLKLHKQGRVKKVSVKYGIPFVPSFLIAFVVSGVLWWFFF